MGQKGRKTAHWKPDLLRGSRECHCLSILSTKWVNNPYSPGKDYVKNGKYTTLDTVGSGIQVFRFPSTLPRSLPLFFNPSGGRKCVGGGRKGYS